MICHIAWKIPSLKKKNLQTTRHSLQLITSTYRAWQVAASKDHVHSMWRAENGERIGTLYERKGTIWIQNDLHKGDVETSLK